MKHKFKIVYLCLVTGIVLLGWGVFARLGQAEIVVTPMITPNTSVGADNTLQLKHMITYRHLESTCVGGCLGQEGTIKTVGQYLGGFVASWRNCDHWSESGNTMACTDDSGLGNFVSAFGILITNDEAGNPGDHGKLQILFPLAGDDIMSRTIPGVNIPGEWVDPHKMMWTAWDIDYRSAGSIENPSQTYNYTWAGFVGGGCENNPTGLCGRVALEHNFVLAP